MKKLTIILAAGFILAALFACTENDPLSADSDARFKNDRSLRTAFVTTDNSTTDQIVYPLSTSKITTYKKQWKAYNGNAIDLLPTNSTFDFDGSSLIPPIYMSWGDPVEITFSVDKDPINNELIFSFGPSGCQFNPAARLKLDFSELGISDPKLYYIENDGNYLEQAPDYIDTNGKWLTLTIDHFSRYAVAYGR